MRLLRLVVFLGGFAFGLPVALRNEVVEKAALVIVGLSPRRPGEERKTGNVVPKALERHLQQVESAIVD